MHKSMARIAVIGGGAAGMMASIAAAQSGAEVTLFDGNEKLGKKVYITGKGRCNVTNAAKDEEFLGNIVHNGRFMYSSFAAFNNEDLMKMIEDAGVPLKIERGGRVFPVSDKASDITKALERLMHKYKVRIVLRARVKEIILSDGGFDLDFGNETRHFDKVICACGGVSYPTTGSDGSGFKLVEKLGHSVTELKPSLIPVLTRDQWCKDLQGLSLKNVQLTAKMGKKVLYTELGEMLFTHFGISGPLVLSMSCYIVDKDLNKVDIRLDMKPGLTREQLEKRIMRDFEEKQRAQVGTVLDGLLPRSMTPIVAQLAEVSEDTPVNQVTREMRDRLVDTLKGMPIHACGFRPVSEAIVTRGGVKIKEINPSTMESKLVPGLYLAGEMLDVDAFTGGFNLQVAFSTGHCAGVAAAMEE